jgi:BirA family transcriptional regulator, biotin operon repressor / biotin---[acetyl-CoA-carboxylase] ligase
MNHQHFESIESTNDFLKNNHSTLPHLTVISAKHQTSGKGRYARRWMDDGTQALFSILLKEQIHTEMLEQLPFVVAKALHQQLYPLLPHLQIKWPNDLIHQEKKLAGVLVESIFSGSQLQAIVIGIGLNVNTVDFPSELQTTATSIKQIIHQDTSIQEWIISFCQAIVQEINSMNSFEQTIAYCNQFLSLKGKVIQFIKQETLLQGVVKQILPSGQLQVMVKDQKVSIRSGEVTILKK